MCYLCQLTKCIKKCYDILYNQKLNCLLPVKTENDGNTIFCSTDEFSRLKDLCSSKNEYKEGYEQLVKIAGESIANSVEKLFVLPFNLLPADSSSNDNGTSDYKEAFRQHQTKLVRCCLKKWYDHI